MSIKNEVYNEPLCPFCGKRLLRIENTEPDFDDVLNCHVSKSGGLCVDCDKSFWWKELWTYVGVTDVKWVR